MNFHRVILSILLIATGTVWAANTPDYVHYQGVLRNESDAPLSGTYSMIFRFFDGELGGSEILIDEHLTTGTGGVVVDGGMFAVALGSGAVSDGTGPGTYLGLKYVFPDYKHVWMQIEIDNGGSFETLSPRLKVEAAPYAQNANRLQGRTPADFISSDGGTVAGNLLPEYSGLELGDTSHRWNLAATHGTFSGYLGVQGLLYDTDDDTLTIDDNLLVNRGRIAVPGLSRYNKFCVADSDYYCMGLTTNETYGALNGVAMTFTMYDDLNRGFLWRDYNDATSDGAMSLTTGGILTVKDQVQAPVFFDSDDTSLYVDPSFDGISVNLGHHLAIGSSDGSDSDILYFDQMGEWLHWSDADGYFEISDTLRITSSLLVGGSGDANYNRLGSLGPTSGSITANSDLMIGGDLEIANNAYLDRYLYIHGDNGSTADGDQIVYFYDQGNRSDTYIQWDDVASITCAPTGDLLSGFKWNITDNTNSGWTFSNGSDTELLINSNGDAALDGTLTQSAGCDLAEAFLGADLPAGTVVALDPEQAERVVPARHPRDPMVVGVVSTHPGVLMRGPTSDAYPRIAEWNGLLEQIAMLSPPPEPVASGENADSIVQLSEDPLAIEAHRADLQQQADALEAEVDGWTRGNVPVALVGRVPVNVDAAYGAIRKGDYLTSSLTEGHGMALTEPGPYFGIAMEDLPAGQGQILVLLQQGWYGGSVPETMTPASESDAAALPAGLAATQEMDADLQLVLDRGADDDARFSIFQNGEQGLDREVFRVDEQGNVFARGAFRPSSMDVAEFFATGETVEPGDVLVVDPVNPDHIRKGRMAADPAVVGVVSTEPGMILGGDVSRVAAADPDLALELEMARAAGDKSLEAELWLRLEETFLISHAAVALTGTVDVKVDAGFGSIRPGDLLVSSPTPGHAMRTDDPRPGTVIGKALGSLDGGTGKVRMLVAPPI